MAEVFAALLAAYSYWTNYSFKRPFTFAAGACIVSNILYCLSYDHGGFLLLAFARFLTGLGKPPFPLHIPSSVPSLWHFSFVPVATPAPRYADYRSLDIARFVSERF